MDNMALDRLRTVYLADTIPWIVGWSGGKDSSVTVQLVWTMLQSLEPAARHKPVHIISTDTGVEQPLVAQWAEHGLAHMQIAATTQNIPISTHRLHPNPKQSFWVNLIGRGYGAPQRGFRWCTARIKITPANQFILEVTRQAGQSIMVLGTRKDESANRRRSMEKYEAHRVREWLSPNGSLSNSWVFSPIEDWSSDEVWEYLLSHDNPWGHDNYDLFRLYREGSPDRECPIVLEVSIKTPSCGQSRFGCWTCTVIQQDRSLSAMVANDPENAWMAPLVAFRNTLAASVHDRTLRDFRRGDGQIRLYQGRPNLGPYTASARERFLRELLTIQQTFRTSAPPAFRDWTLITAEEIRIIRSIWVTEKHEWADRVPAIWQSTMGTPYPYIDDLPHRPFGEDEWALLADVCDHDPLLIEMQAGLLDVMQTHHGQLERPSLDSFTAILQRTFYDDEQDAVAFTQQQHAAFEPRDSAEDDPLALPVLPPATLQQLQWF